MKKGWKYIRLGDIIHIKHGYGFKGKYFVEEPNRNFLLTPGNFAIGGGFKSDKMKYYDGPIDEEFLLKEGDVIVTMTDLSKKADTLGYSAKIPSDPVNNYLHNQRLGLITLKSDDYNLDYIYWLLRTEAYQKYIAGSSSGATVKHTSPSKIYSAKLLVPESKTTQRKIASILSAYDDMIENNLRRIKLLEEKAQLTYEEWFVRMKFPGHETAKFDEETGLPEGWERVKLSNLIDISSSKRIFLADYVDSGIPFYRGKEIILKSKNESLNDRLYISEEKYQKIKSKYGVPKKGDILITAVGTLGYPYLVTESDGDFYFKDGNLIWLKGNENISSIYLISCFKDSHFKVNLSNIAIGSSQKALTIKSLKGLTILNPPVEITRGYEEIIEPILDSIECLQNQNHLLKEARDILLPRLMSGMIDVEELELPAQELKTHP